jgi:hypothetical protein
LNLIRGHTYYFNVKTGNQPFFFTEDPAGGPCAKRLCGTPEAVTCGTVCLRVGRELPKTFYYQSSCNEFLGGLVIVHDKRPCAPACPRPCAPACPRPCAPACPRPCAPACPRPCAPACPRPCGQPVYTNTYGSVLSYY